ncbi:MAG: glycoside hydrolase family 2 TIM barrel-domain containing protein, partial [bacterium]|nr:glycoside hydrolase family 2 TIM barrel-domain containing protein [bacterium]
HDVVWYARLFQLPASFNGRRVLLHFGAVDYQADVWVNGQFCGSHEGGHVPFKLDVTDICRQDYDNSLVLRAYDPSRDIEIPRGKQFWQENSAGCFYTRTTGIWQSVWLEAVGQRYIESLRITPDIDNFKAEVIIETDGFESGLEAETEISFKGELMTCCRATMASSSAELTPVIRTPSGDSSRYSFLWSPENPVLFDCKARLFKDGLLLDEVETYFGMRKISVDGDRFLLNNKEIFQMLLLDQGYWPESLLTPPGDEAIRYDIEMTKKFGFNGVRKHQKVEDPRFLYWADTMGLLVWGEAANAFDFSRLSGERLRREFAQAVMRDYNHPCIVAWVPVNESWGVPGVYQDTVQQNYVKSLYYMIKSLDPTRPVVDNDGWEHMETDLFTLHDYSQSGPDIIRRYADKESLLTGCIHKMCSARGYGYQGRPVIITEYGGTALKSDQGWGYGGGAEDPEALLAKFREITAAFKSIPWIKGLCYTQLTDVEQEKNGLMTYDRRPKLDPDAVASAIGG